MIEIDGSYEEGGGQILRTALAFSMITGKAFKINNIRKNREIPGLKNQHLYCINTLKEISNAQAEGDELGSESLTFYPGKLIKGNYTIDIETAGSITLLLQSLLIPCMLSGKRISFNITGGTDVKWSIPIDYFSELILPNIRRYCNIDMKMMKRGFYPKGGGNIEITFRPLYSVYNHDNFDLFHEHLLNEKKEIELIEQGKLISITGISFATLDLEDAKVSERQGKAAKLKLSSLNIPINISTQYYQSSSTGSGIVLYATFSHDEEEIDIHNPIRVGGDNLGEKGIRAEQIGEKAAENLIQEINTKAPVDEFLADNLIPFIALFRGKIKTSRITKHSLANIYVIEKFLGNIFNIEKEKGIIENILSYQSC